MKKPLALLLVLLLALPGCSAEDAEDIAGAAVSPPASASAGSDPETAAPPAEDGADSGNAADSEEPADGEDPEDPEDSEDSETTEDPGTAEDGWQLDDPANHDLDPTVFAAMHAALPAADIHAVVTTKDGMLVDEYYAGGYDADSLFAIQSASKSFTGALVGIALEEGYLGSIDDPIGNYLPQVAALEDTRKQRITLRHLLTQTSGLEWYEWGGGYTNWGEFRSADNWVDYILGRALVAEPGTRFTYSTGNTHLLAAILQAATGRTMADYCEEKLFEPMGIETAYWGSDPQGITDGGNGLVISARDAAKFGQLYLDGGVWRGQQLVPADWVTASITAQNGGAGDNTGAYGYQWWMRSFTTGSYNNYVTPYPTASYEVPFAFGYAGQFIHLVPALDMVVVFTASCENAYLPRHYLADYVLNAYMGR